MLSPTLIFGGAAMVVPLLRLPSLKLGSGIATMSYFKAGAKTLASTPSMKDAASIRACERLMSRTARKTLEFVRSGPIGDIERPPNRTAERSRRVARPENEGWHRAG